MFYYLPRVMQWTIGMTNNELHRKSAIESVLEEQETQKKAA